MKRLSASPEWWSKVSFAIGKTVEETKTWAHDRCQQGRTIKQIEGELVNLATDNGKTLIFVHKDNLS